MVINTNFSINDTVYHIQQDHLQVWVPCAACNGKGTVILNDGKERSCPDCYRNTGKYEYQPTAWMVSRPMKIGQVTAEIRNIRKTGMFDNYGEYAEGEDEQKNSYMMSPSLGKKYS